MPLVLADRVNETTTTTSTGTLTLAGAVSGYQSFAVIGNGNTTYYTIVHQTANEWEVGIGTYTSSGTLLSRDTVLASSNSGSLVNFSAGTKFVFCDYPAGRAVYLDTATNVTIPGLTLSGGTANGVLYLNGSKVATSGSALTFNGTTLVSPDITDSSLTSGRVTYAGTGGNFVDSANLTFNGTTLVAADLTDSSLTSGRVVFSGAGGNLSDSSSLTWNGTGLGIGVSSASSLLDIAGATPLLIVNQSSGTSTKLSIREGGSEYAYIDSSTATKQLRLSIGPNAPWGGIISFVTNTSERARISAAGNLLLGTTTVAYANTLLNIGSTSDTENGVQITTSTTGSGYILFGDGSAGAAYVGQVKYTHTDNAMSFWTNGTIKTTLTSAGNFGIGTTNPTNTAGFSRQVQIDGTTSCLTLNGTTGSGKYSLGVPGANACGLWDNTTSAYRWYVDSSGQVGLGTTTPRGDLDVGTATATAITKSVHLGYSSANFYGFRLANTNTAGSFFAGTFSIQRGTGAAWSDDFAVNNSGNVGIGTTNPLYQLMVLRRAGSTITAPLLNLQSQTSGSVDGDSFILFGTQSANWSAGVDQADSNKFRIEPTTTLGATDGLTITTAGNLGIGTASPAARLHLSATEAVIRMTATSGRIWDVISGGGGNVGANFFAIRDTTSGANVVQIAPQASEALRIDTSGNVGIGTASPSRKLEVHGTPSTIGGTATGMLVSVVNNNTAFNASPTSGISLWNRFNSGGSTFPSAAIQAGKENATDGNYAGYLSFFTVDSVASVYERMRLDSSGNLGIGTTTNALTNVLTAYRSGSTQSAMAAGNSNTGLNGTLFGVDTAGNGIINQTQVLPLIFSTSNTERARITSGGELLVNTTNNSVSGGAGFKVLPNANGTNAPQIAIVTPNTTLSTASLSIYSTGAAAFRFYVVDSGTIYATSTTITGISDRRVKENIVDLDVGLNAVMALKPRKFDWKAGKGKDIKGDRGFVAQEFEEVFPDLVDTWKDPAPEGEEPYKALRQDLIPVLVKAMQEQQAMIDDLKAKVTALESK
jgi:hypothetical protein